MTKAEARRRAAEFVDGLDVSVGLMTCKFCGHEQADMGKGVTCEECGSGPMPSASYGIRTQYCVNPKCRDYGDWVERTHKCRTV
jgi:hypothetical protein